MTKNIDLTDFENLLILKNQLITLTTGGLKEIYSDLGAYVLFVDSVLCMLEEESAFLYLSKEFPEKILDVLQVHRFDIDDDEITDGINSITLGLNDVQNVSDNYRKMILTSYIEFQKDARNSKFGNFVDFFNALAYDAAVFLNLKGKIDLPERDDDLLFSSISYIIECCPEFFSNKNAYDLAYYELDELSASSGIFDISTKILASKQKKKLKSINKKEEK